MLEAGLRYPIRGDWVGRILIGGLLALFSFLIIPAFIVYGYLLRVLGASYDGTEDPPKWEDWGSLLVTGLVAWLIGLAYAIPLILFSILMVPVVGVGTVTGDPGAVLVGVGLIWALGSLILGLLIAYILPAAWTNYARTGRAGAAFDFEAVRSIAATGEYFFAVVIAIVVGILFGIVTGILAATVIGLLLVPFIGFYANMAMANIVGTGVRQADSA